MSAPTARLKSITAEAMEANKEWAATHIRASTQPRVDDAGRPAPSLWALTPWRERTIADVASLKLGEMYEAEARADKLGDRPAQLAVVVIPARIEDARTWEAKARALDSQGRAAIEATAVPTPPKKAA